MTIPDRYVLPVIMLRALREQYLRDGNAEPAARYILDNMPEALQGVSLQFVREG